MTTAHSTPHLKDCSSLRAAGTLAATAACSSRAYTLHDAGEPNRALGVPRAGSGRSGTASGGPPCSPGSPHLRLVVHMKAHCCCQGRHTAGKRAQAAGQPSKSQKQTSIPEHESCFVGGSCSKDDRVHGACSQQQNHEAPYHGVQPTGLLMKPQHAKHVIGTQKHSAKHFTLAQGGACLEHGSERVYRACAVPCVAPSDAWRPAPLSGGLPSGLSASGAPLPAS